MTLTLIAAMAANRVIGRANRLPWRLTADLRRFKRLTMGHAVLMGRRTWESIGGPLPGRRIIVVSRRAGFVADGAAVAASIAEALALAGEEDVFVAGGAEIYRQTLPIAQRIELTLIERDFEGDATFPPFEGEGWRLAAEERPAEADTGDLPFRYQTWLREEPR